MVKSQTTSITPAQHAARHAVGGADPFIHAAQHQIGGGDEHTACRYSGANVFNAGAPAVYTALDLSGVIGANRALVYLHVTAGDNYDYSFRTNGDTVAGNTLGNCEFSNILSPGHAVFLVMTDAAGIIEWEGNSAVTNTVITLLGYMLLT